MKFFSSNLKLNLGFLLASVWFDAGAQVAYVDYAPYPLGVPALSAWGVLALSAGLAIGGFFALRRARARRLLSTIAACGLAIALAIGGLLHFEDVKAVATPQAFSAIPLNLTSQSGGTAVIGKSGLYAVTNTTSVSQTVIGLRITPMVPGAVFVIPPIGPQCVVGTSLPATGVCYVVLVPTVG